MLFAQSYLLISLSLTPNAMIWLVAVGNIMLSLALLGLSLQIWRLKKRLTSLRTQIPYWEQSLGRQLPVIRQQLTDHQANLTQWQQRYHQLQIWHRQIYQMIALIRLWQKGKQTVGWFHRQR